jgi:glycosyltransferase involved in cell wall biosynthesis
VLVATRRVDFHLRPGSVWHRADRVIAISRAVRAVLEADGIAPRDISVVASGIDPDEVRRAARTPLNVRARLGLSPSTPLAANVAALVGHKDQHTLIRAAHAARAARADLHWAIAGEGELRGSLEAALAGLGLSDRVHLLGHVAEADALIAEADVLVMSSKEEGLGSVVLHALALGTPVVATRAGGLPEMVPEPWLVPVGDADALAHRVVEALDHPSPIPLPSQFTASSMAAGVLAVYRSLV